MILFSNEFETPSLEMKVFPLIGDSASFLSENKSMEWSDNNITDELASILLIVGGLIVAFSKAKDEDEYISKIRTESLIWATYVNYGILILAVIFVYDMAFFNVMIYNMFTILFFFIIRFHYVLYITKKSLNYEE
ncbi:MAG: hypothetical protein QM478_13230 [Flavobacteriaceae bacterium]